jgi:ureidoglycolate dehydrogenase (NAD+)
MRDYLVALRSVPPNAEGQAVMAPGDREWRIEGQRLQDGIPIDPETAAFLGLGTRA